jgi:hypothetical protein
MDLRRALGVPVALTAAATLAACGGDDGPEDGRIAAIDDPGPRAVTFELREQNDEVAFGFVTLDPAEGDRTRIGIEATPPVGLPQPAHVVDGDCAGPDDEDILYELSPAEPFSGQDAPATSVTTIEANVQELDGTAVHVHESTREGEQPVVACADIELDDGS